MGMSAPYGCGPSTPATAVTDAVPVAGRPVVVIVTDTVMRLRTIDSAASEPLSTVHRRTDRLSSGDGIDERHAHSGSVGIESLSAGASRLKRDRNCIGAIVE